MARGYFRGKLLCAAVRLGIADALGADEKNLDEIALVTQSNPDALRRLLRALASIGVVSESSSGRYQLTPFGQPLRRDVSDSVWASILFWADLLADSWTYLDACVRTGSNAGAAAAREREGVRSRWSLDPDTGSIFHQVFAEPTAESMAPFVRAHDFSQYRVVADLGGGGGGLLAAILEAHPEVRGILVDREAAIANASAKKRPANLSDRLEFRAGDLLESVPQPVDVYILQRVLHGYDEANARRLLQNCRASGSSQTRLLVIEAVMPTTVIGPDPELETLMMADINMLAVTGGRERSEAEWSSLLQSAGYAISQINPVPGTASCIIEAAPCLA